MGPILARSNSSLTPGRYKLGTTKRGEIRLWIPQATPDKAFRIFVTLVRDQEVDGSNPFAPTTSFKANNLQRRKVPTTSWLCAKRSGVSNVLAQRSHFPLQIGVKWREAATTFSSFCSPRSPNRTGFGMGRLKPRPTFSLHSSRYWTSSRRASVARTHVVVLMGHPWSRNANVLNQKRFLIAPSIRLLVGTAPTFAPRSS